MSRFFKGLAKRAPVLPTDAEVVRERVHQLTTAMNERRAMGVPRTPPTRLISGRSLERELSDGEDTPSPDGNS